MLIKENFFLFTPRWPLAKNGIVQFLPKHMEAKKISAKLQ